MYVQYQGQLQLGTMAFLVGPIMPLHVVDVAHILFQKVIAR
jgi:hypothetical protein